MVHQQLPIGFKRSRALWDQTQRNDINKIKSYIRAILYELQPIRTNELIHIQDTIIRTSRTTVPVLVNIYKSIPNIILNIISFVQIHWKKILCIILYYYLVRYMHEILDAGPLIIMITALVLIYTIGLSDEGNADGISAYSVFNKGFQKLLGSVDADALIQQHVGGGAGAAMMMMNNNRQHGNNNNNVLQHEEENQIRRNNRRQQQQQQRNVDDEVERNNNINEDEGNRNDDVEGIDAEDDNNNTNNNNRSRKSGKKARRNNNKRNNNNVEQRREIQRQRQAAIDMGFGGDDDTVAMNRLIEDQIMVNN